MAEALDREEYKERMRAAGRRALEEFRRQKGAAARSRGALPGLGTEIKATHGTDRLPTVELTTFRVLTQPAAAAAGPMQQHEPAELHMLTPAVAMASTSVGVLPPGSSCLPPFASSPCSITSGIRGAASVSSLASTVTGFATPAPSAGIGTGTGTCGSPVAGERLSVGQDNILGGRSPGAVETDDAQLSADVLPCAGGNGSRSAASADPFVDMLLMQVQALAREKASLAAENAGLRQQVDQLEELVGVLLAERSLGEGVCSGAELAEGGYETEGSYFQSPSRPQQELGDWQEPGGRMHALFEAGSANGEADSTASIVRPMGEVQVGTSGRGGWAGADQNPTGSQGDIAGYSNMTGAACLPEREEDREHQDDSRGAAMEVGSSSRAQEAFDIGGIEGLGSSAGEEGQQAIGIGLGIPMDGASPGPSGHLDCGG